MNHLPRPLNSDEIPGAQHFNQLMEFVQAIAAIAGTGIRIEESGTGMIIHAEPTPGGGIDSLPAIGSQHERHMKLVLELNTTLAATLPAEEQWKALEWQIGYERLQ